MNSKLKNLAVDSTEYVAGVEVFDQEKFAELILKDVLSEIAFIGVSNFENKEVCWTVDRIIDLLENRYDIKI